LLHIGLEIEERMPCILYIWAFCLYISRPNHAWNLCWSLKT